MKEEKEIYYKPVGGVIALMICYIFTPILLINISSEYLLVKLILGLFLVFETIRVIRKRKEVIVINSKGIMLYRVKGLNERGKSGFFVEWKDVTDIRFWEFSFGLNLVIYHKKKGSIHMDISEYLGLFLGKKRYRQFKKDVYHYYNSAKKKQ